MDPVTVICSAACTVSHVVTLDMPPFTLSLEDGGKIAGAVLLVWAAGWGVRVLIQTLRHTDANATAGGDE